MQDLPPPGDHCNDVDVAYFTAVVARTGAAWRARDVEVDDAQTLDDLARTLRTVAVDDQPVLALVEHEDEWFAVVRVDGEDDPRLFVSDLTAASHSSYGELLASAADVDPEADLDPVPPVEVVQDDEDDAPAPLVPAVRTWAGEPDLLDDLGVSGSTLRTLVEENGDDPAAVLAEIGETVGLNELLEALR